MNKKCLYFCFIILLNAHSLNCVVQLSMLVFNLVFYKLKSQRFTLGRKLRFPQLIKVKICYGIQTRTFYFSDLKQIKWGEFQTISGYINFSFDHLLRKTKAKLMHSGSVIILLTYEHN